MILFITPNANILFLSHDVVEIITVKTEFKENYRVEGSLRENTQISVDLKSAE